MPYICRHINHHHVVNQSNNDTNNPLLQQVLVRAKLIGFILSNIDSLALLPDVYDYLLELVVEFSVKKRDLYNPTVLMRQPWHSDVLRAVHQCFGSTPSSITAGDFLELRAAVRSPGFYQDLRGTADDAIRLLAEQGETYQPRFGNPVP